MKIRGFVLVLTLAAIAVQPALADGRHHHHHSGRGAAWVPFAAGAVIGGLAINAWAQQRPVYAPPVYMAPPPRVIVAQPYYMPPPVYAVPAAPPAGYYYERD